MCKLARSRSLQSVCTDKSNDKFGREQGRLYNLKTIFGERNMKKVTEEYN